MSGLTFTQALEQAELLARQSLTPELHERLSAAYCLVKDGRVFQTTGGDWQVDSATSIGKTYTVNGTCDCEDIHFNKPPQDLCKHRLAMYLARKVQALMITPAPVELPDTMEAYPDNDAEAVPPPPPPAPAQHHEAPASVNVRLVISGREVQWTLRDTDEGRLAVRLEALLARYPQPQAPVQPASQLSPQQHNALAMGQKITGVCPIHSVQMKWNEPRQPGRKGWYSHRLPEGGFCQGR